MSKSKTPKTAQENAAPTAADIGKQILQAEQPVRTATGLSITGQPVYREVIRHADIISIPSLNPQRVGLTALGTSTGQDLIASLAERGYLTEKGLIGIEPFSDEMHGGRWRDALDEICKYLQTLVVTSPEGDAVAKQEAQEALKLFLQEHQEADGKTWRKPLYSTVYGNTRDVALIVARGKRIVAGLPDIPDLLCTVYVQTLPNDVRLDEQLAENLTVGQTEPSTEDRARAMAKRIEYWHAVNNAKPEALRLPPPYSSQDFSAFLSATSRQLLNDDKKRNNVSAAVRPIVVLDAEFPQLKIISRLGAKSPVDGMFAINSSVFPKKTKLFTELLKRLVPSDRMKENAARQKALGDNFVPASSAEHARLVESARLNAIECIYTGEKSPALRCELIKPTADEVTVALNAAVAAPKAGLVPKVTALVDNIEQREKTRALNEGEKLVKAIGANLLADKTESLREVADKYGDTMSGQVAIQESGSTFTARQWLEAIAKVSSAKHDALMNHIKKLAPKVDAETETPAVG